MLSSERKIKGVGLLSASKAKAEGRYGCTREREKSFLVGIQAAVGITGDKLAMKKFRLKIKRNIRVPETCF